MKSLKTPLLLLLLSLQLQPCTSRKRAFRQLQNQGDEMVDNGGLPSTTTPVSAVTITSPPSSIDASLVTNNDNTDTEVNNGIAVVSTDEPQNDPSIPKPFPTTIMAKGTALPNGADWKNKVFRCSHSADNDTISCSDTTIYLQEWNDQRPEYMNEYMNKGNDDELKEYEEETDGCSNDNSTNSSDCISKERHGGWGGPSDWKSMNDTESMPWGWRKGCDENATNGNATGCNDEWDDHADYDSEKSKDGWGSWDDGCDENSTDSNGTKCSDKWDGHPGWGSHKGDSHKGEDDWGEGCDENSTDSNGTKCSDKWDGHPGWGSHKGEDEWDEGCDENSTDLNGTKCSDKWDGHPGWGSQKGEDGWGEGCDENSTDLNGTKCSDKWDGHPGWGAERGEDDWDEGCDENSTDSNSTKCSDKWDGHSGWDAEKGEDDWNDEGCDENSTDANGTNCTGRWSGHHGWGAENGQHGWGKEHSGCDGNATNSNGTSCNDEFYRSWSGWHYDGSKNKTEKHSWGSNNTECDDNVTGTNATGCSDSYDGWNDEEWDDDHGGNSTSSDANGCSEDSMDSNSTNNTDCHGHSGRDEWDEDDQSSSSDSGISIDSLNKTVACYNRCQDVTVAVKTCMDANGCTGETCSEGSDVFSCCSPCVESIFQAANCVSNCLPDTIEESVDDFSSCFDKHECDVSCADALMNISSNSASFAVAKNETVDTGGDMCSDLQNQFRDPVCSISGCCSACEGEMRNITDIMMNQMLRGFLHDMDDCTFTCPKERKLEMKGQSDGDMLRRRFFRKIEDNVHTNKEGGIRSLQDDEEEGPSLDATACLVNFYDYLAIAPDKAFESLMDCFVQGVQTHSVELAKFRAQKAAAATSAPTMPQTTTAPNDGETASPSASLASTEDHAAGISNSSALATFSRLSGVVLATSIFSLFSSSFL
ncbi:hypothetical protein MPSEU_000690400 [Mayamaea pseudoterrestris]|nr:hypothetical protein MPSEU_000690400 [Mayamaea pseudoterrestris]